jgi:HSP20 family protein
MALIRWYDREPGTAEPFDWLQRQINELFDVPRAYGSHGVFDRAASPPVDVLELPESFVVECDLPAVDQKNLDISITGEVLTIKGEKRLRPSSEKAKVYKKETWEGSFQRTISLPAGIDAGKVEATYKDGVLRIDIPKREEAKARRIELKSR